MALRRLRLSFLITLAGLALFCRSSAAQAPPTNPAAPAGPALSQLDKEALGWLQGLIRIDTVNPPGNELAAAKYLADILQKEGIPAEIYESAPGRGVLVARLNSGVLPDPAHALLLMGHLDTVGVQKEKWSVDPFGGVIQDGYLYGRGAIDDKGMVIANVAVLVALKRSGVRLTRDVILLAEGDEEADGVYGMNFVIQKHWDKIACAYAINEGGWVAEKDGKVQYAGIQASEKVSVDVDVIATGPSGHGSQPRKDSAILHLVAALDKIDSFEAPVQLNAVTRAYFESLAPLIDPEIGKWMRALDTTERGALAARHISDASLVWNSMLRDTISPTILKAGIRENVIPSEARAVLNIRMLPGNSIEALLAQLQKLVNDPQVRLEIEAGSRGQLTAPSSSLESELYKTIERVTPQVFAGAPAIPFMSTGATDAAQLRLRNVQAYGLKPFPLTEQDEERMHADDERLPIASFGPGIEYLYRVVAAFATGQ